MMDLKAKHVKGTPDGVKHPFLRYQKRDLIQDAWAVDNIANTMKLTLLGKIELSVSVWSHRTTEQFLMHVQAVLDASRQKCLDMAYDKSCVEEK